MFWDFHKSKRYPCTLKIRYLALKLTILGLKNFMGRMLILGTPFQPLCSGSLWQLLKSRFMKSGLMFGISKIFELGVCLVSAISANG